MSATARLSLPYIAPQQAQKQVTFNAAMTALDLLVQPSVMSRTTTAPPGSPAEGDSYIVAPRRNRRLDRQGRNVRRLSHRGLEFSRARRRLARLCRGHRRDRHPPVRRMVGPDHQWRHQHRQIRRQHHGGPDQPPRGRRRCQPVQPRRQRPPDDPQQGRCVRYREPAVRGRLFRSRRNRPQRRRYAAHQGLGRWRELARGAERCARLGTGDAAAGTIGVSGGAESVCQSPIPSTITRRAPGRPA